MMIFEKDEEKIEKTAEETACNAETGSADETDSTKKTGGNQETGSKKRKHNEKNPLSPMIPFMRAAIAEATEGIRKKHGGPFGSVVVKDGEIVGRGHNRVLANMDPTCHGEVDAIRDACRRLKTYDLSGTVLYTTGEPCPMCLFACMWAKIDKVYYGCTIEDNSRIGFRDEDMDKLLAGREQLGDYLVQMDREECLELFEKYRDSEHKIY